jgi:transcriptional regulator with PAS, ATPase and Fis domain
MPASKTPQSRALAAAVRAGDKRAIKQVQAALDRNKGNVTRAAAELGIALTTLQRWRSAGSATAVPELIPNSPSTVN